MQQPSKGFFQEFKEFALKGSVVDLAVGIIIGTAFGTIVTSLVNDLVMPILGLLVNKVNFENLFINLSATNYDSLAAAKAAGAPTLNYGLFINNIISFVIVSFAVFFLIRQMNRWRRSPELPKTPTTKSCSFCYSTISVNATRCPQCTSTLP